MPLGRILLLAQDIDYRHSLAFLLEAEGFDVIAQAELPLPGVREHDCVVLDHRVLRAIEPVDALAFCRRAGPVILLGARAPNWFDGSSGLHLETPIVENRLITAIHGFIAGPHLAHS